MAKTYQTTRKHIGGRQVRIAYAEPAPLATPAPAPTPAPALAPAQPMENVEDDPEILYYIVEAEDGHITAVDSPAPAAVAPA